MNKHIILKSLYMMSLVISNNMITMGQKQTLEFPLLQTQAPSDQKVELEPAQDATAQTSNAKCCCVYTSVFGTILGVVLLIKAANNSTPPRLFCDDYYLTGQDFANSPNMTWSVDLQNCCFSSGSQTIFGDASLFTNRGSQFTLGQYAYDVAYNNECAGTVMCTRDNRCEWGVPSCPTTGYGSVDKKNPNYFRNFRTRCKRLPNSKKPSVKQKLNTKFMQRSNQSNNRAKSGR